MSTDLSGEGESSGSDWLSSLNSLANIGGNVYKTVNGGTITEAAATATANLQAAQSLAAAKIAAEQKANSLLPWYKQAWFLPVAIGAGLLLIVGVFLKR
jgi:hypothetical protein